MLLSHTVGTICLQWSAFLGGLEAVRDHGKQAPSEKTQYTWGAIVNRSSYKAEPGGGQDGTHVEAGLKTEDPGSKKHQWPA